jgi:hypothetical protein
MNEEARAKLVDAIVRRYKIKQLDAVVHRLLGRRLETITAIADSPTTVDGLLAALERESEAAVDKFLLPLRVQEAPLRAPIDTYYGVPADPEPYDALQPSDVPFVDRQISRDKLRRLFENPNRRAMVIRGARAAGKSHLRWLVEHVARTKGFEPVFVQLKNESSVQDVVQQLIDDLSLPWRDFNDRLAQPTRMTRGFVSALRGYARQMPPEQRWCLIFDNHDYDTVAQAMRDFVDALLAEVADLQMRSIWMVVLGHFAAGPAVGAAKPSARLITDDIPPLTPPDVEKFLKQLTDDEAFAATAASYIFNGLTPPLDHLGMEALADRLREKIDEAGI